MTLSLHLVFDTTWREPRMPSSEPGLSNLHHGPHSPRCRIQRLWSTRDRLTRRCPRIHPLCVWRFPSRSAPSEYPVNPPTRFRLKSLVDPITKGGAQGIRQIPERTLGSRRWQQRTAGTILEEQNYPIDFSFPAYRPSPRRVRNHQRCCRLGNILHHLLA